MFQALDYEDETSFHHQGAHSLMGEGDVAVDIHQFGCLASEPPFYWGEPHAGCRTGPCPRESGVEVAPWQLAHRYEFWAQLACGLCPGLDGSRSVEPASDDYSHGGDWAGESVALEHRG